MRVSVWAVLAAWLARRLFRLLALILSSWSAFLSTVVLVGLTVLGRRPAGPGARRLGGALVGLVLWRLRWPAGFRVHVRCRVRGWLRGIVSGRLVDGDDHRRPRRHRDTVELLPQLGEVTCTATVDRVRVRMLPGQTLDDYAAVADRLGQTFGTLDCRIRSVPRRVA